MIRLGELMMILDLHRQGVKIAVIARHVGVDRKTVRKYIARGVEVPVHRRGVGYVFQGIGLFPHMSVAENIAIGPRLAGEKLAPQRIAELLVGLFGLVALAQAGQVVVGCHGRGSGGDGRAR